MNKKLYWGLGVLFLLITGVFVIILVQQKAELNQWEADAAKDKKLAAAEKPPIVKNNQPTARPGYKQVKHGDHFHEVPIDAPDTWQDEPVVANDASNNVQQQDLTLSAETQRNWREWNQSYMDEMEGDPLSVDHYNFLKEHPDFSHDTASPELKAKWTEAILAKHAKKTEFSEHLNVIEAEIEAKFGDLSKKRYIGGPMGNNTGGDE
jgi:hypothetical protein